MKYNDFCKKCGKKIEYEGEGVYFRCPNCNEKHYFDNAKELDRTEELSHYSKIVNKDLTVDNAKVGDIVRFGDHYWRILESDNDKALLLLDNSIKIDDEYNDYNGSFIIDNVTYSNDNYDWNTGYIRQYLNNDYLKDEFDDASRERIIFNSDIQDKVFLLSKEEIEKYLKTVDDRKAIRIFFMGNTPDSEYLLRSKCDKEERPYIVDKDGNITKLEDGYVIEHFRPAIWVKK